METTTAPEAKRVLTAIKSEDVEDSTHSAWANWIGGTWLPTQAWKFNDNVMDIHGDALVWVDGRGRTFVAITVGNESRAFTKVVEATGVKDAMHQIGLNARTYEVR